MGFDSSSQLNLDFDQSYMSNNDHIYASNNSIRNSLTPQTPRTPSQAQITPPREQPASHVSLQARRKAISAAMAQLSVQRSTSVDGQPQTVRQSLLSPRPPLRLRNPRKRPTSDGPLSPSSLHGQSIYSIPSSPTYPQAGPHGQQMNIDDVMRTGSGEYFTRMPDQRPSDVAAFASRNMSMMDMKGQGQSPGRDRERRSRSHNRESMESDQGSHFGLERSASVGSTSRRSGVMSPPALYRQASLSNFDIVHEGAEEESVADLPRFPGSSHKFSSHRRLGSANSSYLGASFQGSISHDVEKMIQFVEHAMEIEAEGEVDVERQRDQKRPFMLVHAVSIAGAAALVMLLQMLAVSKLLGETRLDGGYIRFLLLLSVPFFGVFSLFFMVVICGSFFQLFGPLGFLQQNTVYYSSKAPKLAEHAGETLPHLTVQMPVYKEGLKGVIIPTITSVLKAVNYYEAHGGSATVLVADDGMQLVSEELQEARKVYYELHDIAWVARPKQCTKPGPNFFLRKGKFKKASNLNYALDFSSRVEDEFLRQLEIRAEEQECTVEDLTVDEEDELLEMARQIVEESDGGRTWSYGDVRIGEFILLIDSDTVVPETCLLAGALEMIESPEVAIIQHSSGVMNQTHNTFENGIHYFTDLIYTSISHAVGAGDVGPFVGHNAFLRWKAIQSVAFQEDGRTKFWSENHVSEDFDVSLRLQMAHFIVRMAGYHNNQFKEGVSLTVYDELARWEKYAYGCNELIFHPLIYWPTRGIFTPLFLKFLRSNVKVTSKFTIIAYIGTYYAIGVGFPLSTMNYFLAGWKFNLDHYYQTSWNIFVGKSALFFLLLFLLLFYRHHTNSNRSCLCIQHPLTNLIRHVALPNGSDVIHPRPRRMRKMDTLVHVILRRSFLPRFKSHYVPLLLHQHRMDHHGQRTRKNRVQNRLGPRHQGLLAHVHLSGAHGHCDGLSGRLCSERVQDYGFHCDYALGESAGLSCFVAVCSWTFLDPTFTIFFLLYVLKYRNGFVSFWSDVAMYIF